MSTFISVVVCTFNRANMLATILQSLCEQSIETSEYEVVVVDNNSTDDTREVVDEFHRCFSNIRYCSESKQGLSHARNRGWREAISRLGASSGPTTQTDFEAEDFTLFIYLHPLAVVD